MIDGQTFAGAQELVRKTFGPVMLTTLKVFPLLQFVIFKVCHLRFPAATALTAQAHPACARGALDAHLQPDWVSFWRLRQRFSAQKAQRLQPMKRLFVSRF